MRNALAAVLTTLLTLTMIPAVAAQVISDNLIVQGAVNQPGSMCVGVDCINNETFSGDTLRLKENNLRIRLHDSTASSDDISKSWYIVANDSVNGGNSYFEFDYFPDASTSSSALKFDTAATGHQGAALGYGSTLTPDAVSVGTASLARQMKHVAAGVADTDLLITKTLNDYSPYAAQHTAIAAVNQQLDTLNAKLDDIETAVAKAESNQPPSAPELVSPDDDASGLDPNSVTLTWLSSIDPEGAPLTYTVTYCANQDFNGCSPTKVTSTDTVALITTLGGGMGVMLLGIGVPGRRGKRAAVNCAAIVIAAIILAACGDGGGSSSASGDTAKKSVKMSTVISGLNPATTYYWKVGVTDGVRTNVSAIRHFTTQ